MIQYNTLTTRVYSLCELKALYLKTPIARKAERLGAATSKGNSPAIFGQLNDTGPSSIASCDDAESVLGLELGRQVASKSTLLIKESSDAEPIRDHTGSH
jgi:hypothetical protein